MSIKFSLGLVKIFLYYTVDRFVDRGDSNVTRVVSIDLNRFDRMAVREQSTRDFPPGGAGDENRKHFWRWRFSYGYGRV